MQSSLETSRSHSRLRRSTTNFRALHERDMNDAVQLEPEVARASSRTRRGLQALGRPAPATLPNWEAGAADAPTHADAGPASPVAGRRCHHGPP